MVITHATSTSLVRDILFIRPSGATVAGQLLLVLARALHAGHD